MTCSQFLNHFQVVLNEHYSRKETLSENQPLNNYILGDRTPNEEKREKQDFQRTPGLSSSISCLTSLYPGVALRLENWVLSVSVTKIVAIVVTHTQISLFSFIEINYKCSFSKEKK